ncbi:NnrS family protein [Shewanella sp. JM162201]|uniref:NnrS family protein n=1 Tax=Shewanella jiangmenensis TaxID=2837387 RepID=A0ABS5UYE0_9GAMM|nr:NnrS family protein [Shewanella jiangmenensis]MBT1443136.1 NnrS family protein [Shewanella jiangmenensis]
MHNIHDPQKALATPALLRLGFRPFFLFGTLMGLAGVLVWVMALLGAFTFTPHGGALWWHGHEMLFGFVSAIIAGFLLTAVQNWTGVPSISGKPLMLLVLLWLMPRLLLPFSALPLWLVMLLDVAFLPVTALVLALNVLKVKQWRNLVFVPILLLLASCNALSYAALLQGDGALAQKALYSGALAIILIVSLLGGRVIPFFTERASEYQRKPNLPWLDAATFIALGLTILAWLLGIDATLRPLAGLSALVIFVRWSRWGWQYSFKVPLLWSLHLSFLFIPIGLALIAAGQPFSAGLHALAAGGMGGMILAMMARVSLGHTGRQLIPPKAIVVAFAIMLLGVILRVLAGLMPAHFTLLISLAAFAWVTALGCFVICYGPMLMRPRADGRPG